MMTTTARLTSQVSPWLTRIAYPLAKRVVLPMYFRNVEILGQDNLPTNDSPVILAPTHRSRWDPIVIAHAAGYPVTGRHLRFMTSANETERFVQGWFVRQLGAFPIDPKQPGIASLRHGIELLQARQMLTIFPEGNIFPGPQAHPLKPGLARLAMQAEELKPGLNVRIVPIGLSYSTQGRPAWGCDARVKIGEPIYVNDYMTGALRADAQRLTADLRLELDRLNGVPTPSQLQMVANVA